MALENYQVVAIIIVGVIILYDVFIKPKIKGILSKEQLELIDFACEKGVKYAEQLYKSDNTIDRNDLAISYALEVIKKAGIVPEKYLIIVVGIIEEKVFNLPKTHVEH